VPPFKTKSKPLLKPLRCPGQEAFHTATVTLHTVSTVWVQVGQAEIRQDCEFLPWVLLVDAWAIAWDSLFLFVALNRSERASSVDVWGLESPADGRRYFLRGQVELRLASC
jgi:hypothetical protein